MYQQQNNESVPTVKLPLYQGRPIVKWSAKHVQFCSKQFERETCILRSRVRTEFLQPVDEDQIRQLYYLPNEDDYAEMLPLCARRDVWREVQTQQRPASSFSRKLFIQLHIWT